MRTIGLLGGMSWESSALYYRLANEIVRDRLGGLHSAHCVLYSVDFAGIAAMQRAGSWDAAAAELAEAARSLESAGADMVLLCTNTMHKVADAISSAVSVPMLNVVDVTAAAVHAADVSRVALLGTRFTMEEPFYRDRLADHGVSVLVPSAEDRRVVHDVIYEELVHGEIREESRATYHAIIERMVDRGAQGVILGCTEIELLVEPADCPVPAFPTTRLHAGAAVEFALS
jgi:aspartate racemase